MCVARRHVQGHVIHIDCGGQVLGAWEHKDENSDVPSHLDIIKMLLALARMKVD